MSGDFIPLGLQSPEQIPAKLQEIEGANEAVGVNLEKLESAQRPWLNTQHQYGYIAPFTPCAQRYYPITSASNMPAANALKGQRINIRLDYLRVYQYPTPWFNLGHSVHTILFTFEARNQVERGKEEPVAFSQLYKARAGQDAAVTGQPVFIGLTVGANGVGFSEAVTAGLNLLTTAQPALAPLTALARGLCVSLASRTKNVPVQEVNLGLDFDTGATGAAGDG
jgi:hypothetical protein